MNKKVMCRMTGPAFFILRAFEVLLVVACSTMGFIGLDTKVFIGAMTLKTFHICNAMNRIVPFLIDVGSGILMALGTRSEFFLLRQFWVRGLSCIRVGTC